MYTETSRKWMRIRNRVTLILWLKLNKIKEGRMNMSKIAKGIGVVIIIIIFWKSMAALQNDYYGATCVATENNVATFQTTDGHLWNWECRKETYEVGEEVVLVMFDFEDTNRLNDQIVEVRRNTDKN